MKKYIILIICCLTWLTNMSDAQVHLTGKLSSLRDSSAIVEYYIGDIKKSTTIAVTDGAFSWDAPITEPQKITLIFPGRATYFFVEPGNIMVTGSRDSLETLRITGSKINDEAKRYDQLTKPLNEEEESLLSQYAQLTGNKKLELADKLTEIAAARKIIANKYITTHPASVLSLDLLSEYSRLGTYEDVFKMYNQLSETIKSMAQGKRIERRLLILKRSAIGEPVMDFAKNDDKKMPVNIGSFRGKYVLIDFWASWCAPCRREVPKLIDTYNKFKSFNFTILSISLDDQYDRWIQAINTLKMPWRQISDLKGWEDSLVTFYGLNGIPATILINPEGKIIAKDISNKMLNEKLSDLFHINLKSK